jgi:hypothetical protein
MPDLRQYTEGAAVVAEARAIEAEARALEEDTKAAFQAAPDGEGPGEVEEDAALYCGLREAAVSLVEVSYGLQDPLRDDPYKTLGAEIIGPAQAVLAAIEDFDDESYAPTSVGRLGKTGPSYETLMSGAERLVALCYQARDPVHISPYEPLAAEIAETVMAIYQTVKTFTPPATPNVK